MIGICVALYFIVGFAFLLIGQILNQKGYDGFDVFEPEDVFSFRIIAMAIVLCWPVFMIFYILGMFIPWLIMSAYKLFVGIIFVTIALFKKEKGEEE